MGDNMMGVVCAALCVLLSIFSLTVWEIFLLLGRGGGFDSDLICQQGVLLHTV